MKIVGEHPLTPSEVADLACAVGLFIEQHLHHYGVDVTTPELVEGVAEALADHVKHEHSEGRATY